MSEDQKDNNQPPEDLSQLLGSEALKRGANPTIDEYPNKLPILPINSRGFMVGMTVPVFVEVGTYFEMLKEVTLMEGKFIGLLLTKKSNQDIYDVRFNDLYKVGVIGRIIRIINVQEAGCQVIINIEARMKVKRSVGRKKKGGYLVAYVDYHKEQEKRGQKELVKA